MRAASLDHPVGTREDGCWNLYADRLRPLCVHVQLISRRMLDRQLSRLRPAQDPIDKRSASHRKLVYIGRMSQDAGGPKHRAIDVCYRW